MILELAVQHRFSWYEHTNNQTLVKLAASVDGKRNCSCSVMKLDHHTRWCEGKHNGRKGRIPWVNSNWIQTRIKKLNQTLIVSRV